ncbi:acyl-CoA dehydrogenase family protein [Actinacidiphila oryziradicis]|uniref:acyl-CoA dehydrogenase family protein n=1 Tax=Actinacidiphila oryziradicis TaxID=2571141 RepID=UPI00145CA9D4|nr:acyl-CoA dehydrogenase family protein [Actinacidiphila oryziradicis]
MTNATASNEHEQVLLAHAELTERQDRLAAASVGALRGSGALALRTPVQYGGAWADASASAIRLTEIGRACPSAAWIAGTCATAKTFFAQSFDEPIQKEYFADPDALACGSGSPTAQGVREAGGVRVTGRWDSVSGCEDADWAQLALMIDGAYHVMVVPVADLTVEQNWHMAGMRGTGSQRLVADGLLVPTRQTAPAAPPQPQDRLFFAVCTLATVVGATQGALNVVEDMFASARKPFMTGYARMGESPGARHWLAEAARLVDRAEQTMLAVAHDSSRADLTELDRARLQMSLTGAASDCQEAVERLLDLHGASGFRTTNALQRYWRDIAVGSRHPLLNPYLATEDLGTALVS